ncbi:MAG: Na+/H+ antiporter [Vulcanimicrobiaceae bacterium]|jgi:CPA1 family monovalent cation:H+ antiporter
MAAEVGLVVVLLLAALPLVGLARRWGRPFPILLVIAGSAMAFVPGVPSVTLEPSVVFLVFLPPLLYWETVTAPTDEMRRRGGWIVPLALGLVVATTGVIAVIAHALLPVLGWAGAFVLGAVVASTDELASVAIAERLHLPRRVVAVIEGEALLNDATSLVLYSVAIAAAVTGVFTFGDAGLRFVVSGLGAVVVGVLVGWCAVTLWRLSTYTPLQAAVSAVLPFVAYLPADHLGFSGVLAVVTAGIFITRYTPKVLTPATRLQTVGWWETTIFLLNVLLYVLLGLQLRGLVASNFFARYGWEQLLIDVVAVNATIVAVRFAWVFVQGALAGDLAPQGRSLRLKLLTVTSLSGARGALSLAAALAIPLRTTTGPFPGRELIVFLTFSVIVVTLVGGGLGMEPIIRLMRIPPSDDRERELRFALGEVAQAGLERLAELEAEGRIGPTEAAFFRQQLELRRERYDAKDREAADRSADATAWARREIIAAQRRRLLALRRAGQVENQILRRVQLQLDVDATQIGRFGAGESAASESELAAEVP